MFEIIVLVASIALVWHGNRLLTGQSNGEKTKRKNERVMTNAEQDILKHRAIQAEAFLAGKLYEDARRFYQQLVQDDPENPYFWNGLALVWLAYRDYEQAFDALESALAIDSDLPLTYDNLSVCYLLTHDYETALDCCETATELDRHYITRHATQARVWALMGEYETALQASQRTLDMIRQGKVIQTAYRHEVVAYHYCARGQVYFLMGRDNQALEDFLRATTVDFQSKFAWAGLAVVHHSIGNKQPAYQAWRELTRLDGRYKDVTALDDDMHPAHDFLEEARAVVWELSRQSKW